MTRIGILSDTHGDLPEAVFHHFADCDEIWHAGDFGPQVADRLKTFKPLRGVYGNIDDQVVRSEFPENLVFSCESVRVLIRHITGSPPRYNPPTRDLLALHHPRILVGGHSHLLKVQFDSARNCLFLNPGAAGKQGWHQVKTLLRITVDRSDIRDCQVIELGRRGGDPGIIPPESQ